MTASAFSREGNSPFELSAWLECGSAFSSATGLGEVDVLSRSDGVFEPESERNKDNQNSYRTQTQENKYVRLKNDPAKQNVLHNRIS
jgi:hypothetical protein